MTVETAFTLAAVLFLFSLLGHEAELIEHEESMRDEEMGDGV